MKVEELGYDSSENRAKGLATQADLSFLVREVIVKEGGLLPELIPVKAPR